MAIGALGWIVACNSVVEGTVTLTIPDGFSGPIVILEGQSSGASDSSAFDVDLHIPDCGVAHVTSLSSLCEWRRWSCRYDDGTSIPLEHDETAGRVRLYQGPLSRSSLHGERLLLFIGQGADFRAFRFDTFATPSCEPGNE
jgi:hypothetical protein